MPIIRPLLRPEPHSFQSENWLLDPGYYWKKIGRAGWDKLLTLEQKLRTLWINGCSTYHGGNDRVPIEQASTLAALRTWPDSVVACMRRVTAVCCLW